MPFSYFFFDPYPGYFLQALPIALLAGLLCGVRRFTRDKAAPAARKVFAALFAAYITGLLCLTLFLHLISGLWYFLLYHQLSGRTYRWFAGTFDLVVSNPPYFAAGSGRSGGPERMEGHTLAEWCACLICEGKSQPLKPFPTLFRTTSLCARLKRSLRF